MNLPDKQVTAWVNMAAAKNDLAAKLSEMELAAQKILLSIPETAGYDTIDAATEQYRKLHTDMINTRKPFTNTIDTAIVQPLMLPEKRVDPKVNATYIRLTEQSLTLRKAAEATARAGEQKQKEIVDFKIFIHNEQSRVISKYRGDLNNEINRYYTECLQHANPDPELDTVKKFLSEIKPDKMQKFAPVLLTPGEMAEIYDTLPKANFTAVVESTTIELDKLFSNYQSDLANAAAAIEHQKTQAALAAQEQARKDAEDNAMHTLISKSEVPVIETPKIKRKLEVVDENTADWMKAVLAGFLVNLPSMTKYMRVKSWGKLSVGQMAGYLGQHATDTGETISNLKYSEVCK